MTIAMALGLSFYLLAGPAVFYGTNTWHLVADTTAFSRFLMPMTFLALVALPLILARVVFRPGPAKGQ
ncbi:hypothetical protein [Streptomyces sp. NPDC001933]|uniref:hypothetical protein n=1 Tax=Streptomyces sp. NPDC001933 TaxID=3364626 RepID=UPI00368699D9